MFIFIAWLGHRCQEVAGSPWVVDWTSVDFPGHRRNVDGKTLGASCHPAWHISGREFPWKACESPCWASRKSLDSERSWPTRASWRVFPSTREFQYLIDDGTKKIFYKYVYQHYQQTKYTIIISTVIIIRKEIYICTEKMGFTFVKDRYGMLHFFFKSTKKTFIAPFIHKHEHNNNSLCPL